MNENEKKHIDNKEYFYYRNSTTILSSLIGGAIVGSYFSTVIGSFIGGCIGAYIGSKNKRRL